MPNSYVQEAIRNYKEGLGQFEKVLPQVAKSYNQFTGECFAEGELTAQVKQLIGLALGVYTNDEYCIIYHTKEAVENGASDQQVLEAAAVAGAFGGGSAMSQAVTLVQEALLELRQQTH